MALVDVRFPNPDLEPQIFEEFRYLWQELARLGVIVETSGGGGGGATLQDSLTPAVTDKAPTVRATAEGIAKAGDFLVNQVFS